MDLTLLLTAIGIIAAIIIGVWQIYLAQKQINVDEKSKKKPEPASIGQRSNNQIREIAFDTQPMPTKRGAILWVDDDIELMSADILSLEDEGFVIQTATSLYKAKEIIMSGQKFDLVITDLMMPHGDINLDKDGQAKYLGLEIAKLAREKLGNIPVLCLTVVIDSPVFEDLKKMRVECLTKPILPSELNEKVRSVLFEANLPDRTEATLVEIKRHQIELTSDSAYIRKRAIWALGELGHYEPKIIDLLKEIEKSDTDSSVQSAAKQAIKKIQRQSRKLSPKRK